MNEIERIKCGNGNVYFVSEGGNAILVDTGREEYRELILKVCRAKNIRLIVLTHGHVDHIQNAAFLSKELGAPIAMHKDDYDLIRDNWAQPMTAGSLLGKVILGMSRKSFEQDEIESFEPEVYLKDGDSLGTYGVSASVIGLPGHTKGSVGVIIGNTDIIAGDALMNMVYPAKSPLYANKSAMEQSAARIGSLGSLTVHFGHGNPVKNRKW